MYHNDVHGLVMWYEDVAVALVFTLWTYDWFAEKIKAFKDKRRLLINRER